MVTVDRIRHEGRLRGGGMIVLGVGRISVINTRHDSALIMMLLLLVLLVGPRDEINIAVAITGGRRVPIRGIISPAICCAAGGAARCVRRRGVASRGGGKRASRSTGCVIRIGTRGI